MYTLGAEIVPYHDYTLDESLRSLAELGFTHINLWTSAAPLAHHINPGDDIAKIKATLKKYDNTPTGLTMYGKTQEEMNQRAATALNSQENSAVLFRLGFDDTEIEGLLPPDPVVDKLHVNEISHD